MYDEDILHLPYSWKVADASLSKKEALLVGEAVEYDFHLILKKAYRLYTKVEYNTQNGVNQKLIIRYLPTNQLFIYISRIATVGSFSFW